jgi:inner centromere protein
MRIIQEQKLKQKEEDEKRREEMERKERLVEENKQRLIEEKKREEAEKLKQREQRLAEEKRKHEEYIKQQQLVIKPPVVPAKPHTAVATPGKYADHHHTAFGTMASNKINDKPKPIAQILPNKVQKLAKKTRIIRFLFHFADFLFVFPIFTKQMQSSSKNLETTYVLNTPAPALVQSKIQKSNVSLAQQVLNSSLYNQCTASSNIQSYACTPLQVPKLKDQNNYDVSDLRSDDETDDEEEPSKPVPDWAKDQNVKRKAMNQYVDCINYTKIFKTSTNYEIKLEEIFRTRRKKFTERSSSAIWNSPPIWKTGINGEDSFRKLYPS